MKKLTLSTLAVIAASLSTLWWLGGCGGGGGAFPSSSSTETGRLVLAVEFPADRAVNVASDVQEIRLAVSGAGLAAAQTAVVTRPSFAPGAGAQPQTISLEVPVGEKSILATGHSSATDNTILTGAFGSLTILKDQTVSATLVMGPPTFVSTHGPPADQPTKTIQVTPTSPTREVLVMRSSADEEESYFTIDQSGVFLHGELNKWANFSRAILSTHEHLYDPPLEFLRFGALPGASWQQRVNVYEEGLLSAQLDSKATFIGLEAIAIPFGVQPQHPFVTFKTVFETSVTPLSTGAGSNTSSPTTRTETFWWVPGIGPVAILDQDDGDLYDRTTLSLLTSTQLAQATVDSQFTLSASLFPLNQANAGWTFVDLAYRDLGQATVGVN